MRCCFPVLLLVALVRFAGVGAALLFVVVFFAGADFAANVDKRGSLPELKMAMHTRWIQHMAIFSSFISKQVHLRLGRDAKPPIPNEGIGLRLIVRQLPPFALIFAVDPPATGFLGRRLNGVRLADGGGVTECDGLSSIIEVFCAVSGVLEWNAAAGVDLTGEITLFEPICSGDKR